MAYVSQLEDFFLAFLMVQEKDNANTRCAVMGNELRRFALHHLFKKVRLGDYGANFFGEGPRIDQ